jgi:gluconokinase
MVIVVMGVAGAGKTTVGRRLADVMRCRFADADDFHAPANVEKMRRGVALDDEDRAPWLAALAGAIDEWLRADACVVLACSALKAKYRAALRRDPARVQFVYLKVPPEIAHARVANRPGHFMKENLVEQQFDALEEPSRALVVDASQPPDDIVRRLLRELPADR